MTNFHFHLQLSLSKLAFLPSHVYRRNSPFTPCQSLIFGNTTLIHLSRNSNASLFLIVQVKETGMPFRIPNCATLCVDLWISGLTPVIDCSRIPATCIYAESPSAPLTIEWTVTSSILGMLRQVMSCSMRRKTSPPRGPLFGLPLWYGDESSHVLKRSALGIVTVPGGLWTYAMVIMSWEMVDL